MNDQQYKTDFIPPKVEVALRIFEAYWQCTAGAGNKSAALIDRSCEILTKYIAKEAAP